MNAFPSYKDGWCFTRFCCRRRLFLMRLQSNGPVSVILYKSFSSIFCSTSIISSIRLSSLLFSSTFFIMRYCLSTKGSSDSGEIVWHVEVWKAGVLQILIWGWRLGFRFNLKERRWYQEPFCRVSCFLWCCLSWNFRWGSLLWCRLSWDFTQSSLLVCCMSGHFGWGSRLWCCLCWDFRQGSLLDCCLCWDFRQESVYRCSLTRFRTR